MSGKIKRDRLLFTLLVSCLLIGGTVLAIKIAKGYRPNLKQLELKGTGLLSATSYPKSAQVLVNGRLTTITDDTLYLSPGEYEIKIIKNGFQPWIKTVPLKAELVSVTDARLFPAIPAITPLTFYQISNALVSPDGSKIAYVQTNSPFDTENGLYVLSINNNLLGGNQTTKIADNTSTIDYSKADLLWAPDGSQILAVFHDNTKISLSHLLNSKNNNPLSGLSDSTYRLPLILNQWQSQLIEVNRNLLSLLPEFVANMATESAANVYFSPDKEKMLYTATTSFDLPDSLNNPDLPNFNPTAQSRKVEKGRTYVLDLKELSNYQINQGVSDPVTTVPFLTDKTDPSSKTKNPTELDLTLRQVQILRGQTDSRNTTNLSWYSTSRHLFVTTSDGVSVVEYDNNNYTPLINAKIKGGLTLGSPDGNRLIIWTNLNQKTETYNLLSLDLK